MPRWDSFARSLVFAALAAAGLPVAVTFAGALLGAESAVRLYVIAVASAYAIGLCPDRSRGAAALAFLFFKPILLEEKGAYKMTSTALFLMCGMSMSYVSKGPYTLAVFLLLVTIGMCMRAGEIIAVFDRGEASR